MTKENFRICIFLLFVLQYANGSFSISPAPSDTSREQAESILKEIHLRAFEERDKGNYEKAYRMYLDVVRLKENYSPDDTLKLAFVYNNFALILTAAWKFEEALYYYDVAIDLAADIDPTFYYELLSNKGVLFLTIRDLQSAITYFEKSEKYLFNNLPEDSAIFKRVIYNKIIALNGLGRYTESLECLESIEKNVFLSKSERFLNDFVRFQIYNQSNNAEETKNIYFELNKKTLSGVLGTRIQLEYITFLYHKLNKIDEAIDLYNSMEERIDSTTFDNINLYTLYNNRGNCYEIKGMYKEALENYQKAIIVQYHGFLNSNILKSPPVSSVYEELRNNVLFKNKGEIMFKYYNVNHDTSILAASLENCLRSINTIQKMRYRITSEQGQFLVSKKERFVYGLTQRVALEQYRLTGDKQFLYKAFEVNEKGKAFTLLSAMRSEKAMNFGDVPEKIRKQEEELNRQLSLYDELLYKEKQYSLPDKEKISNWENQLFNTTLQYDKLLRKLEREYPEYYRLKFDEDITDLYEIQKKIDKNTVLLEYSYLDSVLIIYTASRTKTDAVIVNIPKGFEDKCIEFLNLITTQSFENDVNETFNKYISLAHELYTYVIEPVKDQLNGVNLIIIPDGAISYLPFDALLTSYVPPGKVNYRHMPYLIKDYSVGYSFSSTIHFNPIQHIRIPSESILAFAPAYSNIGPGASQSRENPNQVYLDLENLPGVNREVVQISEMHKTDAFLNMSAKESAFKERAGRYSILHLAMHTMIDNNDPLLSKLIFTQVPDGSEDGLLHTYEIYNLKLNASLTVLSSCSSGYGKIQPGEGVQSLARGFAYAGCPSILMTLWEVNDGCTVSLITEFYKYLIEHRTKPEALRESKLIFLNGADPLQSNPFFWASFVVIGDSSPIYPFSTDLAALNAFLLIIPLGVVGAYYRNYRKQEKGQRKNTA